MITNNSFSYERPGEKIEAVAHLDGMYVIRTSVCAEVLDDSETVKAYKSLSQIEQALRCYKTNRFEDASDLSQRQPYRVRSHVF